MRFVRVAFIGLASAVLAATTALAADFSEPVSPNFSWAGFYGGVHAGYGNGSLDGCGNWNTTDPVQWPPPCGGTNSFDIYGPFKGGLFGGQIGVNHQWDSFVVGAELAGSITSLAHKNIPSDITQTLNPLGTATVHAGFAFDRVFAYGLVGIGGGRVEHRNVPEACAYNTNVGGLVYGAGLQVMVSDNVSLFGEWNHLDFGDVQTLCVNHNAQDVKSRFTTTADIVKVGLNVFWR